MYRNEENIPLERKGSKQEKRSLPESQKDKRKKVSGLVRKHLPEIEKRLVEGDTRDIILDWIRAETGMDIPKTTFIKALYRARQWAKTRTVQTAVVSVQPVQSVAPEPATLTTPMKKPKKHVERAADKPEVSHENVLPEKTTGLQRLRAALNVKTPVLDWEADDRFAKYRNGK